ncbi:unnamed protein product [Tilletia controversa]|uniref:Uncharacterized protein n=1 Tax=Tilletia controversa TaxID=13291 RepID=A0A8X7MVJ0_9BASI|nr:hypothetical protein CF328_g3064 [Tilletia controversa]KAE8249280.1 hypothetical protein A4X06_0g3310 [Tilletia controversa]CAD6898803.1 unnamed protein product [Tilletia controversa]CAD6916759.1 unnamed protein product [Tilletia controversa]CAD6952025.1 unnamed protein product [Tilletia controversa]
MTAASAAANENELQLPAFVVKDLFPDGAPDTLLDSNKPTLASLAAQRLPIVVPWHAKQTIYPGQFFHSRLYTASDPWSKSSAFSTAQDEEEQLPPDRSRIVYLSADGGTSGSFKSTKTQSTTAKEGHESYGFTATVDLGFCSASASLKYDSHLSTNNDDIKTSVRASYRCGTILLRHPPPLSEEAKLELKYGGGIEAFEQKYGDYFVFGYNLGGDNSMMVSTNSKSMSLAERKTLTVKVESFFFDIEFTQHYDSAEASASASLRVTGYDTLTASNLDDQQSWAASSSAEFDRMQRETARMRNLGATLPTRVEEKAAQLGLALGPSWLAAERTNESLAKRNRTPYAPPASLEKAVDRETCDRLIKSCLVVEIVLMPVRSLRQVQYWITEDDVI